MARKILVIGLGSTGADVCDALIERLQWEHESLGRVPWIRFLAIETAGVAGRPCEKNAIELQVEGNDGLRRLLANPQAWDHLIQASAWLDLSLQQTYQKVRGKGAGNVRQLGRLALLFPDHYDKIVHAVEQRLGHLDTLTEAQAEARFRGAADSAEFPPRDLPEWIPNPAFDQSPEVIVVGTLCGGTSSGSFIDLPYILRRLPAAGNVSRYTGIFAMFPPNGSTKKARWAANTVYALREYNHWATPGVKFQARYKGTDVESDAAPYDLFYLVRPASDDPSDVQRLVSGIADFIFHRALSPSAAAIDAHIANLASFYQRPALNGQQQHLATFGVSGIEYPVQRLTRACQLQLCVDAVDRWLGDDRGRSARGVDRGRNVLADLEVADYSSLGRTPLLDDRDPRSTLRREIELPQIRSRRDRPELQRCWGEFQTRFDGWRRGIEDQHQQRRDLPRRRLAELLRTAYLDPDLGIKFCRAYVQAASAAVAARLKQLGSPETHELTCPKDPVDLWDACDDWFLRLLGGRGWAVKRLTREWRDAAVDRTLVALRRQLGIAERDLLNSLAEALAFYAQQLGDGARGEPYPEALQQWLRSRLETELNLPHLTNCISLLAVDEANVTRCYRRSFGRSDTGAEPNARQREAEIAALSALDDLAAKVFPLSSAPAPTTLPSTAGIKLEMDQVRRLLNAARSPFRDLERSHVLDLLHQHPEAANLTLSMMERSRAFLDLQLGEATRFKDHSQKRANFVFYNRQGQSLADNPPAEVAAFAGGLAAAQGNTDLTPAEAIDPHTISAIHEQHAFPLAIIEGMSAGGQYADFVAEAKSVQSEWWSREDVGYLWTPIEEDPLARRAVQLFLLLCAVEVIDLRSANPSLSRGASRDPLRFSRCLRDVELRFTRDLIFDRQSPRNQEISEDVELMETALHLYRERHGASEVVLKLAEFLNTLGGPILELTRGVALTSAAAVERVIPFLQDDVELWSHWNQVGTHRPQSIPISRLRKNKGDRMPGSSVETAEVDGYYCLSCGFYLADRVEAAREVLARNRNSCPIESCGKYYGEASP